MSAATSPELHDRRRRACDAGYDAVGESQQYPANNCIEEAVETATRVRIDKAVLTAAWAAYKKRSGPMEGADDPDFEYVLVAAFEAAGFEVED